MLHYLGYFLQHTNWLVEVYWNAKTTQVFTYRVFNDFPDTYFLIRWFECWEGESDFVQSGSESSI